MSELKTLLVPLGEAAHVESPTIIAAMLAEVFSAHVCALHVRPDPAAAVPLMGEGMSGAMVEEMLNASEARSVEIARDVKAAFDAVCEKRGIVMRNDPKTPGPSAGWCELVGNPDDLLVRKARVNDLTILARPGGHAEDGAEISVDAALMDSGRPLMLAPAKPPETIGKRIAVAWNGSAEAARAAAAALPLLARADHVVILTADEDDKIAGADELAGFLAWHGISAAHVEVPAHGNPGAVLLETCRTHTIDLLVMGAYTHSRLRQMILGGMTKHILAHADLPVLMSH